MVSAVFDMMGLTIAVEINKFTVMMKLLRSLLLEPALKILASIAHFPLNLTPVSRSS